MYVHVNTYTMYMYTCIYYILLHTCMLCTCTCTSDFLISSYGAPLDKRASYLALHVLTLGQMAQLIMIILSLAALTLC